MQGCELVLRVEAEKSIWTFLKSQKKAQTLKIFWKTWKIYSCIAFPLKQRRALRLSIESLKKWSQFFTNISSQKKTEQKINVSKKKIIAYIWLVELKKKLEQQKSKVNGILNPLLMTYVLVNEFSVR